MTALLWTVFNKRTNQFDRIIWRGLRIYRQECFYIKELRRVAWRDVPFFGGRKPTNTKGG